GFGLPIGGVMATARDGLVSAGAVGMDINCGVRLIKTDIPSREVDKKQLQTLLREIEKRIPLGLGKKSSDKRLRNIDLKRIADLGAQEVVRTYGLGTEDDLNNIEEYGRIPGGDLSAVSSRAVSRGDQLGTIGSGNHFIEIGCISEVFDQDIAEAFGLKKDMLTIMVHTGSRGFGHQICNDFSSSMIRWAKKNGVTLPNRGLAYAPLDSELGKQYLAAMASAANFAFANRQIITDYIRNSFSKVFACSWDKLGLDLIYDVAHNIAKFEEYDGEELLVHRKGATRALPEGHKDNNEKYLSTGQPAVIPGTMGTASYVVVGTQLAEETFYSVNHGAGRVLSRTAARKTITEKEFTDSMEDVVHFHRPRKVIDEAPGAYKDIETVVDTLADIEITKKVVQLKPMGVLKG
ncbi:MAG: RtcB family protein, partial [Clostridia bacterium]|nr:RtcB family protein [Clostridia bacterium]